MRFTLTVEEMTIEDAVNVANVIADCITPDADPDLRELAVAAKRLVREVGDQAQELERERARRRGGTEGESPLVKGMPLQEGTDAGGWRQVLAGRPIHAGDTLYLLTSLGWHPVRYETNVARKNSLLYFSLPGVRDDIAIVVRRDARLAWPDELK
jgi:hypothetical protein